MNLPHALSTLVVTFLYDSEEMELIDRQI